MSNHDIEDDLLGTILWDAKRDWYEGAFEFEGADIYLFLNAQTPKDAAKCVRKARDVTQNLKQVRQHAIERAAEKLLKLKNKHWLEDDEAPWTAEQFKDGIGYIESIEFFPNGSYALYLDEEDVFCGHGIEVKFSAKDKATEAEMG